MPLTMLAKTESCPEETCDTCSGGTDPSLESDCDDDTASLCSWMTDQGDWEIPKCQPRAKPASAKKRPQARAPRAQEPQGHKLEEALSVAGQRQQERQQEQQQHQSKQQQQHQSKQPQQQQNVPYISLPVLLQIQQYQHYQRQCMGLHQANGAAAPWPRQWDTPAGMGNDVAFAAASQHSTQGRPTGGGKGSAARGKTNRHPWANAGVSPTDACKDNTSSSAPQLGPKKGSLAALTSFGAAAGSPAGRKLPTTVILRNCPKDCSRDELLKLLDAEGFTGMYDFVHFPIDFQTRAGLGYALVNMVNHQVALGMWRHFTGFNRWPTASEEVCEVKWNSPHQGLAVHIERYRNSPLMHSSVPDAFRPAMFECGVRVPFPEPTSRIRPPRVRHQRKPREDNDMAATDSTATTTSK